MANVSFHWGTVNPSNPVAGGVYLNKTDKNLFLYGPEGVGFSMNSSISSYSWADLSEVSDSGKAAGLFNVGDSKPVQLVDNSWLTVVILGFNHDKLASDNTKRAGITFGVSYSSVYQYEGTRSTSALTSIFNNFPSSLSSYVKNVTKSTANYFGDPTSTNYNVFLLSEKEILNTITAGTENSSQYEFFKTSSNITNYTNKGSWWLRSGGYKNYPAYLSSGSSGPTIYAPNINATESCNFLFGFCI